MVGYIDLFGSFSLRTSAGLDATPAGRKAKGLLAMLALAPSGRRSRAWLQDRLWSGKSSSKSSANLRRELSNLRQHLGGFGLPIISTSGDDILLDLSQVRVDLLERVPAPHHELLEGIDIGEEEFEEWLSEERAYWYNRLAESRTQPLLAGSAATAARSGFDNFDSIGFPSAVRSEGLFPNLAVLAFDADEADTEARQFASGFNDELRTVVAAIAGTFRIIDPRFSGFPSGGYRLDGGIRFQAGYRVHARILTADTGTIIWSDRFDVEKLNRYQEQENLARRIVEGIQVSLSDGRWADYWAGADTNIKVWELFQRGRVQESLGRRAALANAIGLYRQALHRDPGFVQAKISLAFCLVDGLRLCWHANPVSALAEAGQLSREVSLAFPSNLHGQALCAFYACANGDFDTGRAIMTAVIEAAPASPEMLSYLGAIVGYGGDLGKEIALYRHALTLTPHPPVWIRTNLALAQLMSGGNAVGSLLDEVLESDPDNIRGLVARVVFLVRNDRFDEALRVAGRIQVLEPGFVAENWRSQRFFRFPDQHLALARDLAKAGL